MLSILRGSLRRGLSKAIVPVHIKSHRVFSSRDAVESDTEETVHFKSKIYTKTGDKGTSQLYNLQRLPKNCEYFEALGNVDELNAHLGLVYTYAVEKDNGLADQLSWIQSRLFDLGACVATPLSTSTDRRISKTAFDPEFITQLEHWIDEIDAKLPRLQCFILPSGGVCASNLHIARAVCRRAERSVVDLALRGDLDDSAMRFLNRLSDYLFVAARYAAKMEDIAETEWYKVPLSKKHSVADLDAKDDPK